MGIKKGRSLAKGSFPQIYTWREMLHKNSSYKWRGMISHQGENLKQSWLPVFWKKIQNTQTLFNQAKQDKTCKFSRKTSFSSYIQQCNRKQLNQLILCLFGAHFVLFRLIKTRSFNPLHVLALIRVVFFWSEVSQALWIFTKIYIMYIHILCQFQEEGVNAAINNQQREYNYACAGTLVISINWIHWRCENTVSYIVMHTFIHI